MTWGMVVNPTFQDFITLIFLVKIVEPKNLVAVVAFNFVRTMDSKIQIF
jgi:hypothetical protein